MAKKRTTSPQLEEVTDLQAEPAQVKGLDLVAGLVFVTFAALLVGVVLSQFALKKYFDAGLFGG